MAKENATESDRARLSRMAYEAQLLQGQGQTLQQQLAQFRETASQLGISIESLRSIAKGKKVEMLVPVGAGAMVHARVERPDTALIEIGAGVVIEKDVEGAISLLEKRLAAVNEAGARAENEMIRVSKKLDVLDREARELMRRMGVVPEGASEE